MKVFALPKLSPLAIHAASVEHYARTPGVHLSDLVRLVMKQIDPEKYDKEYDPFDQQNWQQAGFLWEELLTLLFLLREKRDPRVESSYTYLGRVGELEKDGILCNPDGMAEDTDGAALTESKWTWMSSRDFERELGVEPDGRIRIEGMDAKKFLAWKFQTLGYAEVLNVNRCYLQVYFVNGNYDRYVPTMREYEVNFTDQEKAENWQMLVNYGKKAGLLA